MDEGIILDFEVDGHPYTVGRPPIRKRSTLSAGEPSVVWRIRNERGHVVAKWPCSDPGLGAVIDERCKILAKRHVPADRYEHVLAGRMLAIAVLQQAKLTVREAGVLNLPPHGVQLSRRAGWRMPPNTIKVSRPNLYSNPFTVSWVRTVEGPMTDEKARSVAVRWFDRWVNHDEMNGGAAPDDRVSGTKTTFAERRLLILGGVEEDLGGSNLACWCPLDQPCHRNVLLRLANPILDLV